MTSETKQKTRRESVSQNQTAVFTLCSCSPKSLTAALPGEAAGVTLDTERERKSTGQYEKQSRAWTADGVQRVLQCAPWLSEKAEMFSSCAALLR